MGADVYRSPSSILTAKKYERDRQRDKHYYHSIWPTHLAGTKAHPSAAAVAATATATAQQQQHASMHGQIYLVIIGLRVLHGGYSITIPCMHSFHKPPRPEEHPCLWLRQTARDVA